MGLPVRRIVLLPGSLRRYLAVDLTVDLAVDLAVTATLNKVLKPAYSLSDECILPFCLPNLHIWPAFHVCR
jgi:hypothetical protein